MDHELILLRWEDVDIGLSQPKTDRATGWDIQGLIDNKDQLQKAKQEQNIQSQNR